MKGITITNEKGGVGKTFYATHLAHRLTELGNKVVFIDADGQGNGTRFFKPYLSKTLAIDFFTKELNNIKLTNLLVFPSTRSILAVNTIYREIIYSNKELLKEIGYEYIIFDTAPTLSKLTFAVLSLSDGAFIPINMGDFALDGVSNVISTIKKVNKTSHTDVYGLMPNFVSGLSKEHKIALGQLISNYPNKILPFLSQRTPYTSVMNGHTPLWNITPQYGNIKQASHQLIGVMNAMVEKINEKELTNA